MSTRIKSETIVEDDCVEVQPAPTSIDMEIDEEEEEEIVREIDVFLSPELSSQLYLMQFPLHHKEITSPEVARTKPKHCMLELDFRTPADIEEMGQFYLPARTYSSQTVPVSTHLALGKMVDKPGVKGLHLVPISRVTQMRPSFGHVDEATSNATATSEEDVKQRERAEASRMERKPVIFQKKESERAALARKSSYSYKKSEVESEMWLPLEVHVHGSPEADEVMEKVLCPSPGDNLLTDMRNDMKDQPFSTSYVNSLNYLPLEKNVLQKDESEEEISNVCSKLVKIMHLGWPIPFSVLRGQFPRSVSDRILTEVLCSCSFLVRGNFVLQSRLIPLKAEVAHARTFILFLLQSTGVVHRSRLNHVYKNDKEVTTEAILMLLQQVATKTSEGWKLKVDDDPSILQVAPSAVKELMEYWNTQVRRFKPLLERYAGDDNSGEC